MSRKINDFFKKKKVVEKIDGGAMQSAPKVEAEIERRQPTSRIGAIPTEERPSK